MRPVTQAILFAGAAALVAGLSVAILRTHAATPPAPRLAFSQLQAPVQRGECRNHQYWIVYTDAHGHEREVDAGQFCGINE